MKTRVAIGVLLFGASQDAFDGPADVFVAPNGDEIGPLLEKFSVNEFEIVTL